MINSICIFAADVSPVDTISHLPISCEENGIPYCYVRSRMELGKVYILIYFEGAAA